MTQLGGSKGRHEVTADYESALCRKEKRIPGSLAARACVCACVGGGRCGAVSQRDGASDGSLESRGQEPGQGLGLCRRGLAALAGF